MNQAILFKVPGRASRRPLMVLRSITPRIDAAHAPRRINIRAAVRAAARALFSSRVSMAVTVVALAAIWWHSLTCPDTLAAQRAAGLDALLASPWFYCALIRKGGEA